MSKEIKYDDKGRPIVKYCPLCGERDPGGIWGGKETASILECSGCGGNVMIDISPERKEQ